METSTSSGVLGSKLVAAVPSTTTGSTPIPSLPVDSAISCSTQSPKPTIGVSASTSTTLSAPARLATPTNAPSRRPGLSVESSAREGRESGGLVQQPADVGAGEPARDQAEGGQG
jgi:hypothetical protein